MAGKGRGKRDVIEFIPIQHDFASQEITRSGVASDGGRRVPDC